MGPSENTKHRASPKNAGDANRGDSDTTPPTTNPALVSIATSAGPTSSAHRATSAAKDAPCVFEQNTRRHFVRHVAGIERDRNHAARGEIRGVL